MLRRLAIQHRFLWALLLPAAVLPVRASLHQAVRARDIEALGRILQRADLPLINSVEGDGVTALHIAAATDQADIVAQLLDAGAERDPVTRTGFTPLHWAVSRRAVAAARELLDGGADPSAAAGNGITPLHWAALRGDIETAALLLGAGADITARTAAGHTPLHAALRQDMENPVGVLLAQAEVERERREGRLLVREELPETDPVVAAGPPSDEDALPAAPDAVPFILPPPERGAFLSVPIGLGETLEFVWVERLGLWAGKFEITNRQYRRFRPQHSSGRYEGLTLDDPDQPVARVSWHDAVAFCEWLTTAFEGRIPEAMAFRLPTNREWTLIASCSDGRRYPWGGEWPPRYGNYSDSAAREQLSEWRGISGYNDGYAVACSVQNSGMNEWGIYGLGGNVWEWTWDWYGDGTRYKSRRGASWDFDQRESMEISWVGFDRPDARIHNVGFRVVVAAPLKP